MWPTGDDTQELLTSALHGDAAAVDGLLERHRAAIHRLIDMRMDRRLSRRVDASDIVQDVMIEASRRLQEYLANPAMPFHLWLRQMAKDRMIDAHRRHRVAARRSIDREQPLVAAVSDEQSAIDLAEQLRDGQLTPAAAATWRELQQRFAEACEQLEPTDQEIVVMRHFEQLTNGEVALALGLTPQAASMRHLRAMRRLREMLGGAESAGNDAQDDSVT